MTTTVKLITADEFAVMSFDRPTELVRGKIVEMTNPGGRHGRVCINTGFVLESWVRKGAQFSVVGNDSGVLTERDPDTVRGPDVLAIRLDRLPNQRIPVGHFTVPPEVAIEVKSPSDRWSEIIAKVGQFLAAGVGEVWVIDPDHRRVHVFRDQDEPTIVNETETLSSPLLPGFECRVADLFHGVEP